jgi:hypothetical protein
MNRKTRPMEERFWEKVRKSDQCWEWIASKTRNGYGFFHRGGRVDRKPIRAHRLSWELHNGPIPDGLWVLHKCDNPCCVRPDHLFIGTRSDNMKDCAAKGRIHTVGKSNFTHCLRGHEFTAENTRFTPLGHRLCIECVKIRAKEKWARQVVIRARKP